MNEFALNDSDKNIYLDFRGPKLNLIVVPLGRIDSAKDHQNSVDHPALDH